MFYIGTSSSEQLIIPDKQSLITKSQSLITITIQWAGERRDYDFICDEFRPSDVTIGDHRFEVLEIKALPLFIVWFQTDGK